MAPITQLTVVDDRYEIVGTLDTGGTGVVYRAVDRRLGRTVAIKVVHTTDARTAERAARGGEAPGARGPPQRRCTCTTPGSTPATPMW